MKLSLKLLITFIAFLLFFPHTITPLKADSYSGVFKNCKANPQNPAIGQAVTLTIETNISLKLDFTIEIKDGSTNQVNYSDGSETSTRTVNLGAFSNPGIYQVKAVTILGGIRQDCTLYSAFSITSGGLPGNGPFLLAPQSPITRELATLPSISIGGLEPGQKYYIKLANWKGGDLANHEDGRSNPNEWVANVSGFIVASNICNNGQADRTNCDEQFGNQVYGLEVHQGSPDGPVIASFTFEVAVGQNPGALEPGHNPCESGVCKTALGSIPTNITAFAKQFLSIAIGLDGGIALILLVYGSIRVLTSSGNQQSLATGRDIIIAAVAGLLFLIFSVLIIRALGLIVGIGFL